MYAARKKKSVYKKSVCEVERRLTADMSLSVTNRGCDLDHRQLMPLFLHHADRDDVLHPGIRDWAVTLGISFGANNMFKGKKCELVSLSLSQAKQPHQLALNLALCRYIHPDHHATTAAHLKRLNLLPALKRALQCCCQGKVL